MPRDAECLAQSWVIGTTPTPQALGLLTLSSSLGSDFNTLHLKVKERP